MNATSPPHLCSGTSLPASPSGSASDRQQRMTTAVTTGNEPRTRRAHAATGDPGIEPGVAVLETTVFPIHQPPTELLSLVAANAAPALGRRRRRIPAGPAA